MGQVDQKFGSRSTSADRKGAKGMHFICNGATVFLGVWEDAAPCCFCCLFGYTRPGCSVASARTTAAQDWRVRKKRLQSGSANGLRLEALEPLPLPRHGLHGAKRVAPAPSRRNDRDKRKLNRIISSIRATRPLTPLTSVITPQDALSRQDWVFRVSGAGVDAPPFALESCRCGSRPLLFLLSCCLRRSAWDPTCFRASPVLISGGKTGGDRVSSGVGNTVSLALDLGAQMKKVLRRSTPRALLMTARCHFRPKVNHAQKRLLFVTGVWSARPCLGQPYSRH